MRTRFPLAAPLALPLFQGLALCVLLCACALEGPPAPAAPAPLAPQALKPLAPAPVWSQASVLADLNLLINDTPPASEAFERQRAALAPALQSPDLSPDLRRALARTLAFDPPRIRQRWQDRQQAEERAAALYAANPPQDTRALDGARVLRRLGPALYLVRLEGGETVFFASSRRFKAGTRLRGVPALERPRPRPDAAKGDLVDELADQPRTFAEISRQDVTGHQARLLPVLAELRKLEAEAEAHQRGVAADLARLDAFTREANAVLGPLLLPRAQAQGSPVRKVARLAKAYSRGQYYRYDLPVTGRPRVDAVLKGYIEERRTEMLDLLRSTGIGRGRLRANVDRIGFTALAASPRLASFRFEEFRDTGGAHPNQAFASFVFDLRTQDLLGLGQIFRDPDAALQVLAQLAAQRLDLALDGSLFPEGMAPKAANFAVFVVDGADLLFTFPPYQVASYAQGAQTLRVPLFHPRLLPLLAPQLREALTGS